jgi:lysophospholipase L1-like esterase
MHLKRQKLQMLLLSCFIFVIFGCATRNTPTLKPTSPSQPVRVQTAATTYKPQRIDTHTGTEPVNAATVSGKNLRVDQADINGLKSAFDWIEQAKGTVVVFLGDSQTYGSYVSAKDTIPAYLEQDLKNRYPGRIITVINLGIKGLRPADAYFIIRRLASMKVDMLIYNITRGWFYPQNSLTYPVLIKLTGAEKEAARWHIKIPAPSRGNSPTRTGTKITSSGNKEQKKKPVILYWRDNPDLIPKGPKTELPPLALNDKNLQWQLYLEAIQTWHNTGRPALFYLSPANWELLKLKYTIDLPTVDKEYGEIANAAITMGIPCQDYTHLISERLFVDEVHLQKKGHLQAATKLAADIAKIPGF